MKEQYGSFSEGDPTAMSASARDDMTEWYDNNRQSYFVKYDGYHSKMIMSSRTTTTAWARNPEKDARRLADFDHSKNETYVVEAKEYLSCR